MRRLFASPASVGRPADLCSAWASALIFSGSAARRRSPAHPQYQLTAESIHITPPPPWIRSDIKAQVLRDAGLVGTLSVLDDWDTLSRRVKDAFEFHPWVASVERITQRLPSSLDIELKYRQPIAAVESSDSSGVMFLPIDEHAVRLPEGDLTEAERRYLPRISGVTGRPLVGDAWDDPRVVGGAKLAAAARRRLAATAARGNHRRAAIRRRTTRRKLYTFEIVTTGGTRIVWGATPGAGSDRPANRRSTRSGSGCSTTPPSTASSNRSTARRCSMSAATSSSRRAPRSKKAANDDDENEISTTQTQACSRRQAMPTVVTRRSARPARRQRLLGALQLVGQFFAHDGQLGRGFDADPHAAVADLDHGHGDLVADENPLADFSTEN